MLYWGEGSKCRNTASLTNSDPDLLSAFLRFLRCSYDVPVEQVALTINCHLGNGLTLDEIEAWWLRRLNLPSVSLRRSTVNEASAASSRKRNTLVYGTARLAVFSTFVVQSIFGGIQAYAGIDRPEWLA